MQKEKIAIKFPFEMHDTLEKFTPKLKAKVLSDFPTADDIWLEFWPCLDPQPTRAELLTIRNQFMAVIDAYLI